MKRLISLLLATVMMVTFVFSGAVSVFAETEETLPEENRMTTSDECVSMLKEYEGFCKYPYADYTQYTIGYGTKCPSDMLSYYREHGITEEEAELLLRNYLDAFEKDVLKFADKYGLTFTQNQFDALVLFSYNCGSGWLFKSSSELHQAVASGADEDELIYRFSLWCTAGGSVLTSLIRRRLCETNMYVNGVYSTTPPENYCYVTYNANGGHVDYRVQGFNANSPAAIASDATYEDHIFLGWFTDKTGGTRITELNADLNGKTLYAQWETDPNAETPDEEQPETPKQTVTVKVTDTDVNYRKGPGTNYTILGQKFSGDILEITDTEEANGYTWGKFADGWIALRYTNYDAVINGTEEEPEQPEPSEPEETEPTEPEEIEPTEPEATEPTEPEETQPSEPEETEPAEPETPAKSQMGTVKVSEYLNIRQNAGTGYPLVGTYGPNDRVEILDTKVVGATVWGQTDRGWISLDYVQLDKQEPEQPQKPEQSKPDDSQTSTVVTGVVVNSDFLRIRSGPGTNYEIVGYLYANDRVTITELKNNGSMTWGKIDQGWISLNYIKLDNNNENGNNSADDKDTEDETPEQSPVSGETGIVAADDFLRVRSGPGTSYAVAGYLQPGEKVTVTEKKTIGNTVWGKISNGWVSLDYIKFDQKDSVNDTDNKENDTSTDVDSAAQTVIGTVIASDFLCVRSGPGTSYEQVGYVCAGDQLTITEQKTVEGKKWGKITQGWVYMDYVRVDKIVNNEKVFKTIAADCLNVRKNPGTGHAVVDYLYGGTKVEILETKVVNGTTWGKVATGWICMDYTK